MLRLILTYNGQVRSFTEDEVEGLESFKMTVSREDDSGSFATGNSSELTFTGKGYEWLYSILFENPNAIVNEVNAKITNDCCGVEFDYLIVSEGVSVDCVKCEMTVNMIENTDEIANYKKLNDTFVFDNWNGIKGRKHPRFVYCNDIKPEALHWVILYLGLIFYFLIPVLMVIISIISIIVNIVTKIITLIDKVAEVLGLDLIKSKIDEEKLKDFSLINNVKEAFEKLQIQILGCGNCHPSPLVRDLIANCTSKYGIVFISSILNNPNSEYYDLTLFSAPVNKGLKLDSSSFWNEANQPLLTCIGLLDLLKEPFNAKYKFIGNTLYFEREDFFNSQKESLNLDYMADLIKSCSKEWNSERKPAYLDFKYVKDAIDFTSNEVFERYNSIQDWNPDSSPAQSGALKVDLINISPVKVIDDGTGQDAPLRHFINTYGFIFGKITNKIKEAILMNNGRCMTYKLIVWDSKNSSIDYAKVKNYGNKSWNDNNNGWHGTSSAYNFPMWCQNTQGCLYDFWKIRNPRNSIFKNQEVNIELYADCKLFKQLNINKPVIFEGLKGRIKKYTFDYKEAIINLIFEI